MKAVFFDRDGTLIVDKNYLHKANEIEYYQDTFDAIRLIQKLGYLCFIVTNQSGVGRGYFPLEDVFEVHQQMQVDLQNQNLTPYMDIKVCPQHPDEDNNFRKPDPKMILELGDQYRIDLKNSYMIGDKLIDAQCGKNAGCHGVTLRLDGHDFLNFNNLMDFALYLESLN